MKRGIIATMALMMAIAASADINEAKALFEGGQYTEAAAVLKELVDTKPKDATAQYYMGATCYALGDFDSAIASLTVADVAGYTDASRILAEIYNKNYNLDIAETYAKKWAAGLVKNGETAYPADLLQDKILLAKNMLERVEKIQIIDTIRVDSVEFFKHYRLSPEAGKLMPSTTLPEEYRGEGAKVVYGTENGKELMWGRRNNEGNIELVVSDILDDGTVDQCKTVGTELNEGGDADFPFIMADGSTLYFANNGENSIGGYDIFMTRRSTEGEVLQPQNIGMPYNSPYNDYMLVIDEERNLGWFVSDREHIPGKVTIYVFEPTTMRQNYDAETENIADLALLRGVDVAADLQQRIDRAPVTPKKIEQDFYLQISQGKIYTKLSDFQSHEASMMMEQLIEAENEKSELEHRLASLRVRYSHGDKSLGNDIIQAERRLQQLTTENKRLTNKVISLENSTSK